MLMHTWIAFSSSLLSDTVIRLSVRSTSSPVSALSLCYRGGPSPSPYHSVLTPGCL